MDEYKVKQLKQMLEHETSESEEHYGARLSHWWEIPTLSLSTREGLKL